MKGEDLGEPVWVQPVWSAIGQGLALSSTGFVRAVSYGETKVTVQVEALSASIVLRVNPLIDARIYAAYINQANQNDEMPVPLLADRDGLLRVFVTVDQEHFYEGVPEIRVEFSTGLDEILTQEYTEIRTSFSESSLDFSYDLLVPGEFIQPGLSVIVTYDPMNEFDGLDGRTVLDFDVVEEPLYKQVIVPMISTAHPLVSVENWAEFFTFNSREAREMRTFLPVSETRSEIVIHETVRTDADIRIGNGWDKWLREVVTLRYLEGGEGYYYGRAQTLPYTRGLLGIAYVGEPLVAVGGARGNILAHEVGHNMGIRGHAPCGVRGVDGSFPYPDGNIGQWGC